MFKNLFNVHAILLTPRRALPWFLCLLTFLTLQESENFVVFAQTCANPKFPLPLGLTSGDTEIFAIDQDSSSKSIFIVGTTTATQLTVSGASKSVFVALFNGSGYTWLKVI
jgi:hypothetical protein